MPLSKIIVHSKPCCQVYGAEKDLFFLAFDGGDDDDVEEDGGNGEDATSAQLSSIQGLAIKYIGLNRTCFCSKWGQ